MNQKGFLGALFDFSFSEFVTTRIIKVLYVILVVLIAIFTLFGVIGALVAMFGDSFLRGLGMLILVPIVALLYLILARAWTEIIIVMFRIAENTTELVRLKGGQPTSPQPPSASAPPPQV